MRRKAPTCPSPRWRTFAPSIHCQKIHRFSAEQLSTQKHLMWRPEGRGQRGKLLRDVASGVEKRRMQAKLSLERVIACTCAWSIGSATAFTVAMCSTRNAVLIEDHHVHFFRIGWENWNDIIARNEKLEKANTFVACSWLFSTEHCWSSLSRKRKPGKVGQLELTDRCGNPRAIVLWQITRGKVSPLQWFPAAKDMHERFCRSSSWILKTSH
jgi:hypothetical protein